MLRQFERGDNRIFYRTEHDRAFDLHLDGILVTQLTHMSLGEKVVLPPHRRLTHCAAQRAVGPPFHPEQVHDPLCSMGPLTYIAMMIPAQLFAAAGSIFSELLRRRRSAKAARQLIAKHLDPLLKATDELQGKLRSLAEEDFAEFRNIPA